MDQPRFFVHASSLLHLVHTVHVTLCSADLHVPFAKGINFHIVNITEMRFCSTVLLATLSLGCIHLRLDRVGCRNNTLMMSHPALCHHC